MARFGKHIVCETNWPKGDFAEFQKRNAERLPETIEKIDSLISNVANLISELPPSKLMLRAWWEMAQIGMTIESESEINQEDTVAFRMLDYVQSLIASVTPIHDQRSEVKEEEWTRLRQNVQEIFRAINFDYQVCLTAKHAIEDPQLDNDFEEFKFLAQSYWCNVRGNRYQIHESAHLSELISPHSKVLEELFNVSADTFVGEIEKLRNSLSFGLGDALQDLHDFRNETLSTVETSIETASDTDSERDRGDILELAATNPDWINRGDELCGRLFDFDLFDLEKVTALPRLLLEQLSWSPGEDQEFMASGEFRGWPLRIWSVFKRPFIRLNGHYYCFDLASLNDHIYRVMQRTICRLKPDYRDTWNRIQNVVSEDLPLRYFQRLLPGANILKSVFYQGLTESGSIGRCEVDSLVIYDEHLFVIEVRAGAFTYTPPATDFPAYIDSLKNLILKPATQGKRFIDYLFSADEVALFDIHKARIHTLRRSDFRHIIICPITLDPLTELASQVQHLGKLGISVGSWPLWAISMDDLRVLADIFNNPLIFLHFVEQRVRAFHSDIVKTDDELDHIGLYLKHNNYAMYAAELNQPKNSKLTFPGYRAEIDKFFHRKIASPSEASPLTQNNPSRVLEIISFLTGKDWNRRSEVTSYLLDLAGESQQRVSDFIDEDLLRQRSSGKPLSFSSHGNVKLSVYCWTDVNPRDEALAISHTNKVLLLNNEDRRFLLELSYDESDVLIDIHWRQAEQTNIPLTELPSLRNQSEQLRKVRVQKARVERGNLGRNEPCPCGSGKKYKKCCL